MHASVADRPRQSRWRALPIDDALTTVKDIATRNLESLQRVEVISATTSLGAVLTTDLRALRPHPPFRASIKDGYAVIASDRVGRRNVIGASCARKNATPLTISTGLCCRISTGAVLPSGADAVVPVEHTKLVERNTDNDEAVIEIMQAPAVGQDIRNVGADVAAGELLLEAGMRIGAAEIALLALNNQPNVEIFAPAHVSIFSTGDELADAFDINADGDVVDTNRPMLRALFTSQNFQVTDLGIVKDLPDILQKAIESGLKSSDVLVTSGGVSMGEKDYLKSVLVDQLGFKIHFGRVQMKPGLPTTFASGQLGGRTKLVFGLPGNPVSTFVTAQLFVVPTLRRISGFKQSDNTRMIVECNEDIILDARPEFRRACFKLDPISGIVSRGLSGAPLVECVAGSQISSRILSTRSANLLLALPPRTDVQPMLNAGTPLTALVIGVL